MMRKVVSFHKEKPSEFGILMSFNSTLLDSKLCEAYSAITLTSSFSHDDGKQTPTNIVRGCKKIHSKCVDIDKEKLEYD